MSIVTIWPGICVMGTFQTSSELLHAKVPRIAKNVPVGECCYARHIFFRLKYYPVERI